MLILLALLVLVPQDKIPDAVKRAQAKLEKDAADPEANLTVGKYLAFDKDDWTKGLPFLAKGGDQLLTPVVEKDIAGTKDGKEMIALGDEWLALSGKRQPKKAIQERALYWFKQAWLFVDGKDKESLRKLFYKIASPPAGYEKLGKQQPPATDWSAFFPAGESSIDSAFAHSGKSSAKLLKSISPKFAEVTSMTTVRYPCTPGKKLTASAWVYSDKTTADGSMNVRFFDADGSHKSTASLTIRMDSPFWDKISKEIEVPVGIIRFDIWINIGAATPGGLWVDDVSVLDGDKELIRNGGFEVK